MISVTDYSIDGIPVIEPWYWVIRPLLGRVKRATIICGECRRESKSMIVPVWVGGQLQDWSIVCCQSCGAPNALPIYLRR